MKRKQTPEPKYRIDSHGDPIKAVSDTESRMVEAGDIFKVPINDPQCPARYFRDGKVAVAFATGNPLGSVVYLAQNGYWVRVS